MRITFPVLLGLIFVVLKLCNVINWSWWYVAMPFWVGFMFAIIFVIGCAVYLTIFISGYAAYLVFNRIRIIK